MTNTTIRISKENKDKLELLKGNASIKYNDVITRLLQYYGGALVMDTKDIARDSVALQLRYWEFDDTSNIKTLDITFQELKMARKGMGWCANPEALLNDYTGVVVDCAELVYSKGDNRILIVKEVMIDNKGIRSELSTVKHFNIF